MMNKRSLIFVLFILLSLCGCKKKEIFNSYIDISSERLIYDSDGGSHEIFVYSDAIWNIASELPSWLSYDKISKDRIIFKASENQTDETRNCNVVFYASGINETLYIIQKAKAKLCFKSDSLECNPAAQVVSVELDANIDYDVKYVNDTDWISNSSLGNLDTSLQLSNRIKLKIKENTANCERIGKVVIFNNYYSLSDTLTICQKGTSAAEDEEMPYQDGQYLVVQESAKGAVDLVIMGDGFTAKDLTKDGTYLKSLHKAMDYFFSIEPYSSYKDYFNVYMVMAESPYEGVGEKNEMGLSKFKNKFDTAFGTGTEIVCDSDLVFEYARKVKELPADKPVTVIVVLNSNRYAGTAYLSADGNSIALCPMSSEESPNDFEGVIHHEAGGHAFGFLCDEYVYHQKAMPDGRKNSIREWQELGFSMNLDFTDDPAKILWKDFIGLEGYDYVGAYEGGYEYQFGVWRSEENSCMNNNIPYYNVQSRWAIVDRIMRLSDIEYTVQDFISKDNVMPPVKAKSFTSEDFIPLGEPVLIDS